MLGIMLELELSFWPLEKRVPVRYPPIPNAAASETESICELRIRPPGAVGPGGGGGGEDGAAVA